MSILAKVKHLLFRNRTVGQTIAKNTFWLTFGEITGRILRTGVVIYAARVLGAEGWGVFSYAMSLAALFTIFSDVGLSAVLIREGAKNPETREKYFVTTLVIKLFLIVFSFIVVMLGAPHFTKIPLSTNLLLFIALLLSFDSLRGFGVSLFRAVEKMEMEAFSNILTQGVILIAGILILIFSPSPEHLAITYAIGSAAGLLLTVISIWPYFKKFWQHFDKNLLKPIFKAAWPFGVAGLMGAVMINTDTIIIGWLKTAADVGYYSAAQKPILLLYMLPSLIAGGFFPVLAKLANKDNERFRYTLERGLAFVFLLAIPFTVGIILTSGQIIHLLFGNAYFNLPTILTLQFLAITLITNFPMNLLVNSVFAYDRQKDLIIFWTIGAIGNAVFDLLLIPIWGIAGAALATVIMQAISNGLIWWKMKKINNFSVLKYFPKIIIATIVMTIVVILSNRLNMPILVTVPVAAIIYLLTLVLLKEKMILQMKTLLKT
ncbi:MAG: flippase [Candidatus Paceibacterota bacterium]|jgi:O-antigen/teichoic acid export membrane protein